MGRSWASPRARVLSAHPAAAGAARARRLWLRRGPPPPPLHVVRYFRRMATHLGREPRPRGRRRSRYRTGRRKRGARKRVCRRRPRPLRRRRRAVLRRSRGKAWLGVELARRGRHALVDGVDDREVSELGRGLEGKTKQLARRDVGRRGGLMRSPELIVDPVAMAQHRAALFARSAPRCRAHAIIRIVASKMPASAARSRLATTGACASCSANECHRCAAGVIAALAA